MVEIRSKTFYRKPNGKFIYVHSVRRNCIYDGKSCSEIGTFGESEDIGNFNLLEPCDIEEILDMLNKDE